ncbi:hypothetical protein SAMN06297229_1521 [Pseudidiomarina planktonica]|uniref:Glycosyl transferase family 2 n=2 Tax=Pseudidiomarina planktonica TaxID=1323738 RepID=A0A1Y6EYT8_9GAMM|nr:hypothetical protein CWI77_01170 [Pseudidiomarina planktonica]SMQ66431.1 hypothetical protein SAMN06297229_1521 [Pseudidiomarina planktonica]
MSIIANIKYLWLRKYKSIAGIYLKKTAQQRVEKLWQERKNLLNRTSNQLNQPLMINLTSFPARFETLHLTLKSLLLQNTNFDRLNLWLFEPDINKLPQQVLELQNYGLSVMPVPTDTRSYKKLIPALNEFPNAFHVTADDDIYYRENWLHALTSEYQGNDNEILCWRAHRIKKDKKTNQVLPYRKWEPKTEVRGPDPLLFFTSGAGVLFPPGSLGEQAKDQTLATKLAPYADDLWWYTMARVNNCSIRRVGNNPKLITWKGSKGESLWTFNKQESGGNDQQLAQLNAHFNIFTDGK